MVAAFEAFSGHRLLRHVRHQRGSRCGTKFGIAHAHKDMGKPLATRTAKRTQFVLDID